MCILYNLIFVTVFDRVMFGIDIKIICEWIFLIFLIFDLIRDQVYQYNIIIYTRRLLRNCL